MDTTRPLPGHTTRRPVAGDAEAIHELVAQYDTQVIGAADCTLADIADELAEPGFDPGRDGWLVHDAAGALAGWGRAVCRGGGDIVDVEVVARPGTSKVAEWLWEAVLGRAAGLGAEAGHPRVRVDAGIYRQDSAKAGLAAAYGLAPATSFHRMRIDHSGPPPRPAYLPGVTVHQGHTEEVREQAHRVHQEAFAGHFGFVPTAYDAWREELVSSSAHDWDQLLLARVHGEPAAMLLGTDHFVPDGNCGYVRILAVRPRFRSRGLGRLLLGRAFAADAGRGRAGTYLHVDAGNTTPALDLYLSAGMRPVLVIDVWRKTVTV
ncbi:ribosomal protein S18 acetylase RimI-like enzyme [Thermocatellispora tengchongensis]|uniref:Ribosomal protein S18 acetylase RimI-like enzyme n=1 Tax=Thermocatellispora tengchongensis TaxID=1073253 RepID=A0A840P4N4_9ACTN|nr:GNAT family N-acetyltransferase [Thermocatellispora tengchongensis]MBB5134322.1 ribosomal protein S18 acetylase RimI-like enzyme [Thermocatellispora tengchongensis]